MELLNLTILSPFIGLVTIFFGGGGQSESRRLSGKVRRHFFVLSSSLDIRNSDPTIEFSLT